MHILRLRNKVARLRAIWRFDNRIELFLNRILYRNFGLNIYRMKGMDILVNHSAGDECGAREVLISPMYQQFFINMKMTSPINVLDFGANGVGFLYC
jgi:hypothetical protein